MYGLGQLDTSTVYPHRASRGRVRSRRVRERRPGPCRARHGAGACDPSVEEFLDDTLPDGTSGTVVAARDGEIAHCRGFGLADREAKVAAGCDTAYDIMSMTKQFTAAAILKLEMMGKLSVSDPMSKFVGPVPDDKHAITVHHLLTHTSGLTDQLGGDYEALSREEMLEGALESELRSAPGTEYSYSNLGYSILAAIVEKASGTSYERVPGKPPVRAGGHERRPATCSPSGNPIGSRWSTTRTGSPRASRSIIPGPKTDHTGTFAATAECSPPRAICSAGTWRSEATRS